VSQGSGGLDPRRWLALALLGTAFFMVILDGTIVYVALPSIKDPLDFTPTGLQWVMSAYLLSFSLVGGNLVLVTAGICIDGVLLIVTMYAQDVLGYSTLQFGLMTSALTIMSVVGAYSAQGDRDAKRVPARRCHRHGAGLHRLPAARESLGRGHVCE
jgi:MFS family permease